MISRTGTVERCLLALRLAGLVWFCSICPAGAWAEDTPTASEANAPDASENAVPDWRKTLDTLERARPRALHIEAAALGDGIRPCDVTFMIRSQCDGRPDCVIDIPEKAVCRNTDYRPVGIIERLSVTYRCRAGEPMQSVTADPPERMRLHCALHPGMLD